MCGRYALTADLQEMAAAFGAIDLDVLAPRYNIAPTQPILVVIAAPQSLPGSNRPDRRAMLVRWGFVPSFIKDPREFPLVINARSETVFEKASFRAALRHRRVLIPANGFYEWRKAGKSERAQPFWIRPRDGGLIAFAGLMECWASPDGSEVDTAAIITTAANDTLSSIHARMPVIIKPQDHARWLDCRTQEPRAVADLLASLDEQALEAIPVSDRVNAAGQDGPELQMRAEVEPLTQKVPRAKPAKPDPTGEDHAGKGRAQLSLF
ncbi:hypothetical protein BJF93_17125 [Xaviernesmea oryzae]|uniref:Abasic site processing protein n=1 Tax=Xaviernesmea oryzae TaxID=464029 RepID=A0A1Q9AT32_9HYPH|nr:SOS response-associated peptidase [Xaviernesmea oryzae]OLP58577.1 hypothetical protein BJF93_17125 [Xaviernesmea oryzae]SEK62736.1 Putative SOS response-associated peptidase YedK [Xaviernesmea oryzae]